MPPQTDRIAVLVANLGGGGAQRRMVALANGFAAAGHPVDLLVAERAPGGRQPAACEVGPGVARVSLGGVAARLPFVRARKRRRMLAAAPALGRYLAGVSPHALLSSSDSVNVLAATGHRLARSETKLVVRVDNPLGRGCDARSSAAGRRRVRRARWAHARADCVVAISEGVARDLRQYDAAASRLEVIHNPVFEPALSKRAREDAGHPWLAPGEPPVVLAVGRLVPQKDFATLVRAFARVRRERACRLLVLGEGRERRALERLSASLGVDADVDWPGVHRNPPAAMARAAVFVLSSRWEGFGTVLVEALAAGCPVVATDCPGGPSEILAGGRYGHLVSPGAPEALARAIDDVLGQGRDALDALGASGRLRAAAFAVDAAVDRYLEILCG